MTRRCCALWRAVTRGDEAALAALYDRHAGWLTIRLTRRCAIPDVVDQVLKGRWATWLNEHTTDAQLAAALGIQMPSAPLQPGFKPGPRVTVGNGPQPPSSPVCTS